MENKLLSKKEMSELMPGYHYVKPRADKTYKEADLHLEFCNWVKKHYSGVPFIRHEKEAKRSKYMQSLIKKYNGIDGIADFELLQGAGMYIEFKKPGEKWVQKDGITVKKEYQHQYEFHLNAWENGRCAYFCNDIDIAKQLFDSYIHGRPEPKQVLKLNIEPLDSLPF